MDKIIDVNEKFAYAVVEPGVTFTDLYNYCNDRNLKVWPSVPSLGWGSVIGNVCLISSRSTLASLMYATIDIRQRGWIHPYCISS
jgi:hypothetical protein